MISERKSNWCQEIANCWKAEAFRKSIGNFYSSGDRKSARKKEEQYKKNCNHQHTECYLLKSGKKL
ncbi:hypothetical protein K9L16_00895 [Candidatus Pacearchaeota archaeon]|nr:hypothetical protein [Candidatus Pacearchaeota archaeon]